MKTKSMPFLEKWAAMLPKLSGSLWEWRLRLVYLSSRKYLEAESLKKGRASLIISASKYFRDDKYTNLSLHSQRDPDSLGSIAAHFSKNDINLVFMNQKPPSTQA